MNHDLAGIDNLIEEQSKQLEKIKFYTRVDNEIYLRQHPELEFILETFLIKLLEDRPENVFEYAGRQFNKSDFKSLYDKNKKS